METWETLQSLIKSNCRPKTNVVPNKLIGDNGELLADDINTAETFDSFFMRLVRTYVKYSVFIWSSAACSWYWYWYEPWASNGEELIAIIKGLKNFGAWAHNISVTLFKFSFQIIPKTVLHLFNVCPGCWTILSIFKIAVVNPNSNNRDEKQLNNYIPISLLPLMSKILQKLILHRLKPPLAGGGRITPPSELSQ